jgi:phage terminase large subunit GpA-like protein
MTDKELLKGLLDGLRPIERLLVSEWADRYRYLSPTASAEPGLWRTARTPYLKEILDRLSDFDPCQEIVVMKGAQLGFTEAGNNWLGYLIDIAPCPILAVMPTDETVKRNSKIRIAPMIEATPNLRDKIAPSRSRDADNTTYTKAFPGGVLVMTGANSAVGLRSMPVKALFLDEVDGYVADLDGEGSPIELAKARTRTFAKRKIFIVSTPTVEGGSAIDQEFQKTDRRYYFVPCPLCGAYQTLTFDRLVWEKGKPETVRYHCIHCEEAFEERHKSALLARGEWRATCAENVSPRKYGYHINSLYSPLGWYSWSDVVREYEDTERDPTKKKTFVNTVLGETFKEEGDAPEWEHIYNKRIGYALNKPTKEVAFLTAGVDVQKDRLEIEIVGWCKGKRSYSIDYRVIMGDTSAKPVWDELSKVITEQWEREDGAMLPLRMMCVDTGYNTQHVYNFCRRFDPTRVVAIKGKDNLGVMYQNPKMVDTTQAGKKIGRVRVWQIDVSMIKSELYGFLRLQKLEDGTAPEGYCYFPQYDQNYFKGITAEHLEFTIVRGFKKYQWVKKFERNEPLDCRVYARAAAAISGMDRFGDAQWDAMSGGYQRKAVEPKPVRKKKDSGFWN